LPVEQHETLWPSATFFFILLVGLCYDDCRRSDTVIFDGTQSDQALGAHTAAGGGRSSSAISPQHGILRWHAGEQHWSVVLTGFA
jgi:hypothetical protein